MKLYKRERYLSKMRGFYHTNDIIKVVTGIRRCGKSTLLQMVRDELLESGIAERSIIYIDLDKKGYRSVRTADQLEALIDSLSEGADGDKFLFIDEIQNVQGFEEVVNAYRSEGDYSIFITGSNSYLLSGELTTKLTGRYLEFELFTLSFDEYVGMKRFYGKPVDPNTLVELNHYINEGGFPRAVLIDGLRDKREYAKGVVDEIFKKDIRKRAVIRRRETFDLVRDYVINNFGATTSVNNILTDLNRAGLGISKPTLLKYLRHLVDAKILYECDRFDMKSRRMLSGEKKYYIADLSLTFVTNPNSSINYGPILENIVYVYSRSMDYEAYVGRIGRLECDFILKDVNLNYSYVQVAYTILGNKETEDREYAPLERIADNYPKFVLTCDFLIQSRNGISHANLMDFILGGKVFC